MTSFDMVVLNQISRYHLAMMALHRVRRMRDRAPALVAGCKRRSTRLSTMRDSTLKIRRTSRIGCGPINLRGYVRRRVSRERS
jgi:hypothetical protein